MRLDTKFIVDANCKRYKQNDMKGLEDVLLKLELDKETACNFIFRSKPSVFNLGKYKVILKYDDVYNIKGIALIDEPKQDIYIVMNMNDLINEITEGYIRTRVLEKISSLMEIEFETSYDNELIDEFDLKDN